MAYEYQFVRFSELDKVTEDLNTLAAAGWRVVNVVQSSGGLPFLLLERERTGGAPTAPTSID
jgi:hypothetical protein